VCRAEGRRVGPVKNTVLVVELDIDRLRQSIVEISMSDLFAAVWPAGISTLARRGASRHVRAFCVQ